ncbi:hypothetical protein Q2T40_11175 [Winogradskyella maritima]|uniref:Transglutaminase superfamily protein n=1 Tax=Winogradskyella maritima TaxID=1517766 RepID=A0ABV8AIY8_9FLAO|nr:hypothetical protein [Winogradskyella maritima]
MDSYLNKNIYPSGELSLKCIALGLHRYGDVINFVHQLPYGRNSDRKDFKSIINENKGTCSTKHAFLKAVAEEQGFESIKLVLGIYKMTAENTKGISNILLNTDLDFIPEAHTYLKYDGKRFDLTFPHQRSLAFDTDLLEEYFIQPEAIGSFKLNTHQNFIKQWILDYEIDYSFEEIWTLREACISELST